MNRNFARIDEADPSRLKFAPDCLGGSLDAPTAEQYIAEKWLPVAYNAPEPLDGMVARFVRWDASDGRISRVYEYDELTPAPDVPKRYSKKKFSLALARRGIFGAFDEWAKSTEVIEGSGLTIARVLADSWFMQGDDPEFIAVKGVAESKFGVDKIAEVLAESEDEEW